MSDILFLTPLMPFPAGHGSAMRASVALEILAEQHRVFVVNTDFWGRHKIFNEQWVRKHAAGYVEIPMQADAAVIDQLLQGTFGHAAFEGIYTFRLCMAPLAVQVLGRMGTKKIKAVLDLDDDEVQRAERFLSLREAAGQHERAARERAEIARLRMYYKMFFPRFDPVLLAGLKDRDALAKLFPQSKFAHLRNVIRKAAASPASPVPGRLLFVGNLS